MNLNVEVCAFFFLFLLLKGKERKTKEEFVGGRTGI